MLVVETVGASFRFYSICCRSNAFKHTRANFSCFSLVSPPRLVYTHLFAFHLSEPLAFILSFCRLQHCWLTQSLQDHRHKKDIKQ